MNSKGVKLLSITLIFLLVATEVCPTRKYVNRFAWKLVKKVVKAKAHKLIVPIYKDTVKTVDEGAKAIGKLVYKAAKIGTGVLGVGALGALGAGALAAKGALIATPVLAKAVIVKKVLSKVKSKPIVIKTIQVPAPQVKQLQVALPIPVPVPKVKQFQVGLPIVKSGGISIGKRLAKTIGLGSLGGSRGYGYGTYGLGSYGTQAGY